MKIVCLGDSITYGYGIPRHLSWVSLVDAETRFTMINAGVNGDTTSGMLARFQRDVLQEKPDALLLLGGVNDLNAGCGVGPIQSNVTAIIQQAVSANITPILGTILPVYRDILPEAWRPVLSLGAPEEAYNAYRKWLLAFGESFQVKCVDFYTPFSSQVDAAPTDYMLDGLHPNKAGHRLMADILRTALSV